VNPTFTIVDVFAEEKYAGNQLAVVRGAGDLSDEALQKITREMNYSETTFILSEEERDGGYDVRIFTPGGEVPFAGHPTLGTAYVIRNEILATPAERVVLNLEAGRSPSPSATSSGCASSPRPSDRCWIPTGWPGSSTSKRTTSTTPPGPGSLDRTAGHHRPAKEPRRPAALQGELGSVP
jgi:predicted PhzF superfamily epimerase YddE/YHI9